MDDLFIKALRGKFTYATRMVNGLDTQQLFDLPLSSKNGHDLDTAAITINSQLVQGAEVSFVSKAPSKAQQVLRDKLEVVKAVIKIKQDEAEKAQARVTKAEERRKILEALAAKDDQALTSASREDLLAKLGKLDAED